MEEHSSQDATVQTVLAKLRYAPEKQTMVFAALPACLRNFSLKLDSTNVSDEEKLTVQGSLLTHTSYESMENVREYAKNSWEALE